MSGELPEHGATTTEFAVIYSLLLGLVLTVIHFGLVFHANLATGDAADAALEAYQAEGGSASAARAAAEAILGVESLLADVSVSVTPGAGTVVVRVSANSPSLVPGLPNHATRAVSGPIERFIPEPER